MNSKGLNLQRIKFPKVIRTIRLDEFHPDMGDQAVEVWVNPHRAMMEQYFTIKSALQEALNKVAENGKVVAARQFLQQVEAHGEKELLKELLDQAPDRHERKRIKTDYPVRVRECREVLLKYGLDVQGDQLPFDPQEVGEATKAANQESYAWHSEILSQGDDPDAHVTQDFIEHIATDATDVLPDFYPWLIGRVHQEIRDFREGQKKG